MKFLDWPKVLEDRPKNGKPNAMIAVIVSSISYDETWCGFDRCILIYKKYNLFKRRESLV